jgi:hypothetical protein
LFTCEFVASYRQLSLFDAFAGELSMMLWKLVMR